MQVGTLGEQLKELPLSALLAAAFITYLPCHPEEYRARVLKVGQGRDGAARGGGEGAAREGARGGRDSRRASPAWRQRCEVDGVQIKANAHTWVGVVP